MSNPAIGTIVDKLLSIMKKLNVLFVILLLISFYSCKRKYHGCCNYTYTTVNNGQQQTTDYCINDISKEDAENRTNEYKDLKSKQGQSIGAPYEYTISGEGCNFTKGKK